MKVIALDSVVLGLSEFQAIPLVPLPYRQPPDDNKY